MSSIQASTKHQYNVFYMLMIIVYVSLFSSLIFAVAAEHIHIENMQYMYWMLSLQCLSQGLLKHKCFGLITRWTMSLFLAL